MAINLDNVKAITHNNKDVVKIEDSNGNVIWTKPSTDPYIFRLNGSGSTALNTRTLEFTNFDAGTNTMSNYGYAWTDGTNVYMSRGNSTDNRYQRKINFNGDTVSSTTNLWTDASTSFFGYNVFTDGTNIFESSSLITSVNKLTPGTSTWTPYTLTATMTGFSSDNIFRFAGTTYCVKDSNHIIYLNGTSWGYKRNVSGTFSAMEGKYFWSPDGVHLFYTNGTYNYKINTSDFSTSLSYWAGATPLNVSVGQMFKIGNDVYLTDVNSSTGVHTIYKLDLTTLDSNTLTWTDVTSQFTIGTGAYITGHYINEDNSASPACGYGVKGTDLV